ncbi:TPA: TIGR03757 family integrating conjugative element protein [Citrobacter freundii]|nr:TIGR03757 family integrating conjugative element protein [Citrobacter freundii]
MRVPLLLFTLLSALTAQSAAAQAIIYTTSHYSVTEPQPGIVMQILEDVQQLEQSLFPVLSENPTIAEQLAKKRMQQPDWQEQEARLIRAYQALTDAYTLGIEKIPAVVLDNQYVVYGTTDVRIAQQKLDAWREQQP